MRLATASGLPSRAALMTASEGQVVGARSDTGAPADQEEDAATKEDCGRAKVNRCGHGAPSFAVRSEMTLIRGADGEKDSRFLFSLTRGLARRP